MLTDRERLPVRRLSVSLAAGTTGDGAPLLGAVVPAGGEPTVSVGDGRPSPSRCRAVSRLRVLVIEADRRTRGRLEPERVRSPKYTDVIEVRTLTYQVAPSCRLPAGAVQVTGLLTSALLSQPESITVPVPSDDVVIRKS